MTSGSVISGGGIAVLGISGRMGQSLVRALQEPAAQALGLHLSGALASNGSPYLGQDAGAPSQAPATGVVVTADRAQALAGAAVAIDFTLPAALHVTSALWGEQAARDAAARLGGSPLLG